MWGLEIFTFDEALWAAKIHTERVSSSLTDSEIALLHDEIIQILQLGIVKGGTTIRTYHNAFGEDGNMQQFLQVYGKTGEPCPRCATPIEKIKVGVVGHIFVLHVKNDDKKLLESLGELLQENQQLWLKFESRAIRLLMQIKLCIELQKKKVASCIKL